MSKLATPLTLRNLLPKRNKSRKKHSASFEDILLQDPHNPTRCEQALWRAVILQMVTDALSNSEKPENQRYKREALAWLTNGGRDFRTVCEYAGYDPAYLYDHIMQFLATHRKINQKHMVPKPGPKPIRFKSLGSDRYAIHQCQVKLSFHSNEHQDEIL